MYVCVGGCVVLLSSSVVVVVINLSLALLVGGGLGVAHLLVLVLVLLVVGLKVGIGQLAGLLSLGKVVERLGPQVSGDGDGDVVAVGEDLELELGLILVALLLLLGSLLAGLAVLELLDLLGEGGGALLGGDALADVAEEGEEGDAAHGGLLDLLAEGLGLRGELAGGDGALVPDLLGGGEEALGQVLAGLPLDVDGLGDEAGVGGGVAVPKGLFDDGVLKVVVLVELEADGEGAGVAAGAILNLGAGDGDGLEGGEE